MSERSTSELRPAPGRQAGPAPMAQWLCHRLMCYWVRISVPAPTQSGFLKAQWVGVRPLRPLISH